ncbi:MAG: aminotransferase class III-fold pyridoxal phosphate-dependent enzyme, partial [Tateyamaria sp.]
MLTELLERHDALGITPIARANLIASENRQSPLVRSFLGTDAASRYSFAGEDGARAFPGGNVWVDLQSAGEAALCRIGGATHCNLRPLSGLHAMTVAILALSEPGDCILSLDSSDGGHYATGGLSRRLGRRHASFRLNPDGSVDVQSLAQAMEQHKPTLVYVDQCHGLIPIDLAAVASTARAVDDAVIVHGDVSHGLGLIFAGVLPNPLDVGCDSYGGSTHKTFPGPQKGVLLTRRADLAERFAAAQFEAISNHHLHVSVALSVALLEFEECGGPDYAARINQNVLRFADTLHAAGITPERKGGTYSGWHQLWMSDTALPHGAAAASAALREVGIIVNLLPDLPGLAPLGLRLGFSEFTHLGLDPDTAEELAAIVVRSVQAGAGSIATRDRDRIREMICDAPRPFDFVAEQVHGRNTGAVIMPWRDGHAAQSAPKVLRGQGVYLQHADGRRVLSAKSGALNANLGFGREDIAAQAHRQMVTLPSNDATSGLNGAAVALAERLAAHAGHGLDHTLFCNSGSEATEAAIKVTHAVARARHRADATRLICFDGAYHGCTAGALPLTGFDFPRAELDLTDGHLASRWPFPQHPGDLDPLARALEGPLGKSVAGIILEPVQGIGGIRGFSGPVLRRLRMLAHAHDLILVYDETFSGLGRTGAYFAFQHHGVRPDVLLCSKGLTAGHAALSAVTMSAQISHETLKGDVFGAFRHGHTMSGNATACAIANAVIDRIDS